MNKNKILTIIFLLWIFIALTHFTITVARSISSDLHFFFSSDEKKKEELYGGEYFFYMEVEKNYNESSYCLLSQNGKAFFLGKYLFFPKKVYLISFDKVGNCASDVLLVYSAQKYPAVINKYKLMLTIKNGKSILGAVYKKI